MAFPGPAAAYDRSMESHVPKAAGARLGWEALDAGVRGRVEEWLGSPVVYATTQPGGFSPGVAARVRTAGGRRVFVKAVTGAANPRSPELHRREIGILGAIPASAPVPRLLWHHDEGTRDGWVVLVIEDVDGWHPAMPWNEGETTRLIAAIDRLAEALTPSPVGPPVTESTGAWTLLRAGWWAALAANPPQGLDAWSRRHAGRLDAIAALAPEASRGESLVHLDLRGDNMLFTADEVLFVDWAHTRVGAPWNDLVWLAPSVEMQGGPACGELFARSATGAAAHAEDVTAVLAAVAGFFTAEALMPEPPSLPGLRAFQDAQGAVARRWLSERTGLD